MKSPCPVLSILLILSSIASNAQDTFRLEATFTGLPDSTTIILNRVGTDFRILETEVTIYLENNRFSFSEKLERPTFYHLRIRPRNYDVGKPDLFEFESMGFWAENTNTSLTGNKGEIMFSNVTGSPLQEQFEEFVNLEKDKKNYRKSATDSLIMFGSQLPDSIRQSMIQKIRENSEVIKRKELEFLLSHPEYYFTRNELLLLNWGNPQTPSSLDLRSFYSQLPSEYKNDPYGKKLGELIKGGHARKELHTGDRVLPFELPDSAGNVVSIASLRKKVLLLDFWGSGCMPCLAEHVNYVKLYEIYRSKGFEILSVSVDSRKELWKRAMNRDKINWLSVWDREFSVYDKYRVQGLPSNFLIDENGLIIARDLRGEVLAKRLEQLFKAGSH
jgi:peroxiredoxin